MTQKSPSESFREVKAAFRLREKSHVVLRLRPQELGALTEAAVGRSASAALEEIVSDYLHTMERPERIEYSIKKTSFLMSAALINELKDIAKSSGTNVSAIIRAAIRDRVFRNPKA